jgi:hypothetical protein
MGDLARFDVPMGRKLSVEIITGSMSSLKAFAID